MLTTVAALTNSVGSATSDAATLNSADATVAPPTITTAPGNQTATAGQTATFTVVAAGTALLGYQWQKNGANIAGATAASYTTPVTTTADSGSTFAVGGDQYGGDRDERGSDTDGECGSGSADDHDAAGEPDGYRVTEGRRRSR